ncbi:hypothetical protein Zm00014a_030278, partial [Zea mays]
TLVGKPKHPLRPCLVPSTKL